MTIADVLLLPLYLLALLVPAVGFVLTRAARRTPRITALSWAAGFVDVIAVLIITYLFAVANSALGYLVPREFAQVVLRGVLIALGLLSVDFLFLYRTGRFGDQR